MKLQIRLDEFSFLMQAAARTISRHYNRPILNNCSIRFSGNQIFLNSTDTEKLLNIDITEDVTVIEPAEEGVKEIHFDPLMAIRTINMIEADAVTETTFDCFIETAEKEILLTIMRQGSKKKLVVTSLEVVNGDYPQVASIYNFEKLKGPLAFDFCVAAYNLEAIVKLAKRCGGSDTVIRFMQADGMTQYQPFIVQIRNTNSEAMFEKMNIILAPKRNTLRPENQIVKCFTSTVQPVVQA